MDHGNRSAARSRSAAAFNQRGVTLIETLVALGIFAFGVSTVGGFLTQQIRHASSNNLHTIAYGLAEQQMEAIRTKSYEDMAASSEEITKGNTTYSVVTEVLEGAPGRSMKRIAVNVSWNEPGGTRNVNLQTIYTGIRR